METLKKIGKQRSKLSRDSGYTIAVFFNSAGLFLLISLWSYAVFVKLADWPLFTRQMQQQPFSPAFKTTLTFAVPILEALAALLLVLELRNWGLWASLLLLSGFTVYVILVLSNFFPTAPCSCGGLISKMSWKTHLWFNIGFIFLIFHNFWFKVKRKGGAWHRVE